MAADDFQEKTEKATPRKREKAREEGQVAKSVELPSVFLLLASVFVLYGFGYYYYKGLLGIMHHNFVFDSIPNVDIPYVLLLMRQMASRIFLLMLPVFAAVFFTAMAVNFFQVGFVVSFKAIEPKLSKMSLIKGFGRLFSSRSLVEAVKSIVKLLIIGIITYYVLLGETGRLEILGHGSVGYILLYMLKVVFKIFIYVLLVMIVVAILDYVFQKWHFEEKLKMSKHEVKDEAKQAEGDPLVKSRIKSLQLQVARRRMMQEVPEADVVVTNPTRLALAIKYDSMAMGAPQIVAKGAGRIAERIRSIAQEHQVPVVENKELAQNLYKMVDIGEEVPVQFFQAVAELLAYVYRLKGKAA